METACSPRVLTILYWSRTVMHWPLTTLSSMVNYCSTVEQYSTNDDHTSKSAGTRFIVISRTRDRPVWIHTGSPYSITTERRVPELIPVPGSQPAGDVSHKPGSRLPLLSARPAIRAPTLATLKRAATIQLNISTRVQHATTRLPSHPPAGHSVANPPHAASAVEWRDIHTDGQTDGLATVSWTLLLIQ